MIPKVSKLILLATYWNEIDWIKLSLEQIKSIEPDEVIICDGCFDNSVTPIHSTDGTKEIIESFVKVNKNARLIPPVRTNRVGGFTKLIKGHGKNPIKHYIFPSRYLNAIRGIRKAQYRINQALTFNKMITISKLWKPGNWFMNYDADQFYSDKQIKLFKNLPNTDEDIGLFTAQEKTFFNSLEEYTRDYEKRNYNNMPHKIYPNTIIVPTRDIYLEHLLTRKRYWDVYPEKSIGDYFHYKLVNRKRYMQGYKLGDRIAPSSKNYFFDSIKESDHPWIIRKHKDHIIRNVL